MRFQTVLVCAVMVLAAAQPLAYGKDKPEDAVQGLWLTDNGDSRIEIIKVTKKIEADDGKETTEITYNGKIAWIVEPLYGDEDEEAGKPQRDRENPDQAKQKKPLVGLLMLKSFKYVGENKWTSGTIYDPTNGKTYRSQMTYEAGKPAKNKETPAVAAKLHVRGYLGVPAFGRTTIWTRYTAPKEEKAAKVSE
jgi:uncharacterized protein (DUF2147 family)